MTLATWSVKDSVTRSLKVCCIQAPLYSFGSPSVRDGSVCHRSVVCGGDFFKQVFYSTHPHSSKHLGATTLPKEKSGPKAAFTRVLPITCWVKLTQPYPRIAEQAQPSAIFSPLSRAPGVGDRTGHPLRMGHHDGHPAIRRGEAGNT